MIYRKVICIILFYRVKKCVFAFSRIEDPDEAQDHFIVARSNCKGFAFVHIAHAQFEVSQGTLASSLAWL